MIPQNFSPVFFYYCNSYKPITIRGTAKTRESRYAPGLALSGKVHARHVVAQSIEQKGNTQLEC